MFQFPRFPSYTYLFSIRSMILHHGCSHIRKSADRSLFAAPRSLSQLITSFFGSQCQGILHMLFFAWTTFCISGDILRFSFFSLELLCFSYLQFKTFYRLWQNCFFFTLYGKTWFQFADFTLLFMISSFPLLLSVMYVTFILLRINMSFLLFGFQWAFFFQLNSR